MNNDWCCICGEDACDELREGSPVCDFHRSMVDGGYTLDELREERDAEDDDTQKLPDIRNLVAALTEGGWHAPKGDQRYEALVDDSGWDGEALAGEIVRDRMALARAIGLTADDVLNEDIEVITERIAEIIAENERHEVSAQSLIDQRNSLLNDEVKIHALLATVDWSIDEDVVTCVAGLVGEVAKLRAELRKQGRVIDTLKRARDRYLQRLADVRAERDALKAESDGE